MAKKDKIEKEVQKTLECFDQAERLTCNPFFYTRLKAQIDELNAHGRQTKGWEFAWSVLKSVLLLLIVALNIFTASLFLKGQNDNAPNREELINTFAQEFTLDSTQNSPNLIINK